MRSPCIHPFFAHLWRTYSTTTTTAASSSSNTTALPYAANHRINPNHHDLDSFLDYAARTALNPATTIYTGTHYEYTVLNSLARLGLTLSRTGGVSDKGIDLLGTWALPSISTEYPLKVLVQCKALKQKAKPAVIRELEGAFVGAPAGWRGARDWAEEGRDRGSAREVVAAKDSEREVNKQDLDFETYGETGRGRGVIALLVAPKEATKGVRDAMGRSRWPMGYAKIDLGGRVEQLLWNKIAAQRGLEGVGVVMRHIPRAVEASGDTAEQETVVEKEVVLTWKGEPWEWKVET